MKKLKGQVIYLAYLFAWRTLQFIPAKSAYSLLNFIADCLTASDGVGVKRMRQNYARVKPKASAQELDLLVKDGMRSYLRYWGDTFRLSVMSDKHLLANVHITREHILRDALAAGNGCIVSLPHAGNWDLAGAYFCKTGAPLVTVAEHLNPEKLFLKFLDYRRSIGMEVLDASGRSLAVLAQRLRANRLIALVADRDLSNDGVHVQFCGGIASMPAGPAALAIQSGAPLITAFVRYEDQGIHIYFDEAIPVPENGEKNEKIAAMIQVTASRLEGYLEKYLSDWHMMQRIWIDGAT